MKHIAKILAVGAVLAASAQFALAGSIYGQISIQGSDTFTSTNINFVPGSGSVNGTSTGTLAVFTQFNPVALMGFNYGVGFSPTSVFSTTEGGDTLSFMLNNVLMSSYTSNVLGGYDLSIQGTGDFTMTGQTTTFGTFDLTSQSGPNPTVAVTFSDTSFAVSPEPSSLILMGTGLLSSAAMMIRSRRRAV